VSGSPRPRNHPAHPVGHTTWCQGHRTSLNEFAGQRPGLPTLTTRRIFLNGRENSRRVPVPVRSGVTFRNLRRPAACRSHGGGSNVRRLEGPQFARPPGDRSPMGAAARCYSLLGRRAPSTSTPIGVVRLLHCRDSGIHKIDGGLVHFFNCSTNSPPARSIATQTPAVGHDASTRSSSPSRRRTGEPEPL